MCSALVAVGAIAAPIVYTDESAAAVREELLALDGVLVWVNPIEQGRDRTQLDQLLLEVADTGVFVSAHPDVIEKLGTKEVLIRTQDMSWGTEAWIYRTYSKLRDQLPDVPHARPGGRLHPSVPAWPYAARTG